MTNDECASECIGGFPGVHYENGKGFWAWSMRHEAWSLGLGAQVNCEFTIYE